MTKDKNSKYVFIITGLLLLLLVNGYIYQLKYEAAPIREEIIVEEEKMQLIDTLPKKSGEFLQEKYAAMALSSIGICFLFGGAYWWSKRK